MSRVIRAMLMALTLVLQPYVAAAYTPQREVTFEEVQTALTGAGYDLGPGRTWPGLSWTSDALAMRVDATLDAQQTSLWVFVYPTTAAAGVAHGTALAQAQARLGHPIPDNSQNGPQLLSGYGASYWWRNVAVVQQAEPDDVAAWLMEPDDGPVLVSTLSQADGAASLDRVPRTSVSQSFIDVLIPALSATVESATAAPSDATVSRHVVDRWYLEPSTVPVTAAQPMQVADRWYLEPTPRLAAPAVSTPPSDRWYLETRSTASVPTQTRHVVDRWYLEP